MASSKAGLADTECSSTHHCKNCGNDIEEYFFMTTNRSDNPSDVTYHITCIKCGKTSPALDTIPESLSRKDPPGGMTGAADDFSSTQPIQNSDDVVPRKISKGNSCATEMCSSKRQKLGARVSVSPQTSTQVSDTALPTNSKADFVTAKSSFFSQACSCGSSDRSDFSYVADNEDGEILMRECKKCRDVIGLDDTTYNEVLSWMDDSKSIRMSICDCGNENPDTFVFELVDSEIVLRCGKCRKTIPVSQQDDNKDECVVTKKSASHASHSDADPPHRECTCLSRSNSTGAVASLSCTCVGHPCGRTKIGTNSVVKLNPGDHVAWHRPLGYWHHAIVVRCSSLVDTTVRVIHYAEPTAESTCKGKVVEDWIDMCKQRGDLYRLEYKPETVFDSDKVIERARTRLNEVQYNVFDNNCEHFARWCKTGIGMSEQVESFTSTLKRLSQKTIVNIGAKTARTVVGRAITMVQEMQKWKLGKLSLKGMPSSPNGATVAKSTGRDLTRKQACSVVTGAVAFTVVVGIEVYSLYNDIKKAQGQHRLGNISQQVYINIAVKRTCRAVGAVVGATAGAVVPIPVVGTLIGSTLGSLIGEGVGELAGRHTSALLAAKLKS